MSIPHLNGLIEICFMQEDTNPYHRKSIRLKRYDYSQQGLYFITLCCQHKAHLFGRIQDHTMILNPFGKIVEKQWLNTEQIRSNIQLGSFIVMPNHFHAILEIIIDKTENNELTRFKSPSQTIGSIVRGFKIAVIKQIKNELQFHTINDNYHVGELQFAPTATIELITKLDYKIWQRNYYEHIIRNDIAYQKIVEYIIENPMNWDKDALNDQ